ncbi:hypothetical protein SAMN03080598_02187 [Algoriphagus boritolerans DSM 17298 = JCM 18970]|uniref:Uncharacterized protein n=2 Tax=Algoriphagus TaxID=246875 RepID=A0A1H5WNP6_9BACT|nr:hypothetical protein SAMN03080598_02187 [Algoriphagus boritolerans DSM 17298 = JCM 18970]
MAVILEMDDHFTLERKAEMDASNPNTAKWEITNVGITAADPLGQTRRKMGLDGSDLQVVALRIFKHPMSKRTERFIG